ncbi:MAG: ribonuclease E/G, partial [Proteobacteria bacterium]|nr:ribonuclease E/G [Pseudomonadota bacterium]
IDMGKAQNRAKVYNALNLALKKDKAKTNILKVSEFGIIEMTRKRTRESIGQALCEPCQYCDGNGLVKGKDTIMMEIYRELKRELPHSRRKAMLYVNPTIADAFKEDYSIIDELQGRFKKKVVVKPVDLFHIEQFEIV